MKWISVCRFRKRLWDAVVWEMYLKDKMSTWDFIYAEPPKVRKDGE